MRWDPTVDANGNDGRPLGVLRGIDDSNNPEPYPWGYWVVMTADPTTYDASGVEFYFECGDHRYDSGWISFTAAPFTYSRYIGSEGQSFWFRVRARDRSGNHNVTGWSSWEMIIWP
jgi:hypothetical protein